MRHYLEPGQSFTPPKNALLQLNDDGTIGMPSLVFHECRYEQDGQRFPLAKDKENGRLFYESHWGVFADMADAADGNDFLNGLRKGRKNKVALSETCRPLFGDVPLGLVALAHPMAESIGTKRLLGALGRPQELYNLRSEHGTALTVACQQRRIDLIERLSKEVKRGVGPANHDDALWWVLASSTTEDWTTSFLRDAFLGKTTFKQYYVEHDRQLNEYIDNATAVILSLLPQQAPVNERRRCTVNNVPVDLTAMEYFLISRERRVDDTTRQRDITFLRTWLALGGEAVREWSESMGVRKTPQEYLEMLGREELAFILQCPVDMNVTAGSPSRPRL